MDTITREEVEKLIASCGKMRKLLAAMKEGVNFLEKKIEALEVQGRKWDFRLAYRKTYDEEMDEFEN